MIVRCHVFCDVGPLAYELMGALQGGTLGKIWGGFNWMVFFSCDEHTHPLVGK